MKHINAENPLGIEPKTSWKTKVLTTKPLQNFISNEAKFHFIVFGMKLFRNF
jgi:hypothetical protein